MNVNIETTTKMRICQVSPAPMPAAMAATAAPMAKQMEPKAAVQISRMTNKIAMISQI